MYNIINIDICNEILINMTYISDGKHLADVHCTYDDSSPSHLRR